MAGPRELRKTIAAAVRTERELFVNSASMVGTAVGTSLLGAAFWLIAARELSQNAVGVGSAAVSAMTLIGFLATVGLGTLLMGELPRRRGPQRGLISAALVTSSTIGAILGLGFALLAPLVSPDLEALRGSLAAVLVFAVGCALTAGGFVLDQALIGLLRGGLQLARNIVSSIVKLVLLVMVALALAEPGSVWIYSTWVAGTAISLVVVRRLFVRGTSDPGRPTFGVLRQMRRAAASHHAFNLALRTPDLMLPLIVITLLSATSNANFFIAWMIAGLLCAIPVALSTVLYAVGSGDNPRLAERFRLTLSTSFALGLLGNLALLVLAGPLLHAFGPDYSSEATTTLQILALGVFPETIKTHYVAVHRVERRIPAAIPIVWGGTLLELVGGAIGASAGGLTGVAIGWLAALCVEAIVMGGDVRRTLRPAAGERRESLPTARPESVGPSAL